ncbi:MAG TPA: hypothetical protein VE027_00135 [Acidimicrobiia bacterium]|nr:hypothetical protein [Acidimicrobiia bacterium]
MDVLTGATGSPATSAKTHQFRTHVYLLSLALAVVAAAASALTFFVPGILLGPAVSNGNARGTALVILLLAIPVLLLAIWLERRGSWRAVFVWLGALFYLVYNAFLFLFLTPFNSLFLLYIAYQALALFSTAALVRAVDPGRTINSMRRLPVKGLAIFVWTIVVLNAVAWLQVVVPAVVAENPASFLEGLGVATNAVYVQDLAFWLPLMTVAAWWMWHRRPLGILLTGSWLVFGAIESVGIAVDQWFGHRADPLSPHASDSVIPMMVALAIVNLIGVYFYLRRERRTTSNWMARRP